MVKKLHGSRARGVAGSLLCAALMLGFAARAAEPVSVRDAWVRAPAPGQKVAGAYLEIVSDEAATLVGAASPAAARAELHTMSLDGGVMKMRQVQSIDLPARKPVKLAPGSLHVMLMDLRQPLRPGDEVPLILTVRRAGATLQLKVAAVVRSAAGTAAHGH